MIEPFVIAVPDVALDDLHARLALTRWPTPISTSGWELGTDETTLRRLVDRWSDGYDWRAHERAMNDLPHFIVDVDGAALHFVHLRGENQNPFPLLLTRGWPGSFLELLALGARLAQPSRHGGDAARSFDVVIPSLPGFAFSAQRPRATDPWSTPALGTG